MVGERWFPLIYPLTRPSGKTHLPFAGTFPSALSSVDGNHPDTLPSAESTGRAIATAAEPEVLLALAEEKRSSLRRIGGRAGDRLRMGPPRGGFRIEALASHRRALWKEWTPKRSEV
jgi:hypothetical protein